MKKSLQYVLIMSALGLQSGVLHAQMAARDQLVVGSQAIQPMFITLDNLKKIVNEAQAYPDLLGDMEDLPNLTQLAPNGNLDWENIKERPIRQQAALINLLVHFSEGQKFVHFSIPRKDKENILLEIARSGRELLSNLVYAIRQPSCLIFRQLLPRL